MNSMNRGAVADAAVTPTASRTVRRMPINLAQVFLADKRDPAKPSFVGPAGTISYGRLNTEVRRLACALDAQELSDGCRVAISLDDSIELAVIFLACLATGAVPLVINPNLDARTLSHVLRDSGASAIFTKSANRDVTTKTVSSLPHSLRVIFADAGDFAAGTPGWVPEGADPNWDAFRTLRPDDLVLLQYTSGTTGRPKGVMHSTRSVLASCIEFAENRLGLTADDTFYSVPKTFFGYGMGNSLFFPLYLGATAVLDPRWPTPATVADTLVRYSPTAFFGVPTLYRKLLENEKLRPEDCALRLAFSAGAPLPEQLREAWRARFGLDLHDGIGATELCHVFATTYPDAIRPGSLGRMLPGFGHRIVDDRGISVARGEVGVLMVEASCSAIGYWNNADGTRAKFTNGWFRTGDLFSEDGDGFLYFHGREDDRFKVFGRWVAPLEIETLLKDRFPEIADAFVVPGQDALGEIRPVLFLMSAEADFDALAERASTAIADNFESCKKPAVCLPLNEVPCNANGKVDRRALVARANAAMTPVKHQPQAAEA